MKSLAGSLIAGSFILASAARTGAADVVQFPPDRALPDVLYYIGAESNDQTTTALTGFAGLSTNEFGDQEWPTKDSFKTSQNPSGLIVPQQDWIAIDGAHSRWNSTSGYPGYSYYFHVEHGLRTPSTSDEKSEVALPFSVGPGQDFYFGISILMLPGYVSVSKWNLFFQLHSSMVLGSMVGLDTSPGMWGGVEQSALGVHYQSGDARHEAGDKNWGLACAGALGCPAVHPVNGKPTYYFEKFADNSPGTWNDIILHVKLSSFTRNITLNSDGILEVWHRKAGGSWTDQNHPLISKTGIVLGVTYSPKGMIADTYPRIGLYRDTWCDLARGPMATNCILDTAAWAPHVGSVPDSYRLPGADPEWTLPLRLPNAQGICSPGPCSAPRLPIQPPESIYLDNIVMARTLQGAKSVFPADVTGDMGNVGPPP